MGSDGLAAVLAVGLVLLLGLAALASTRAGSRARAHRRAEQQRVAAELAESRRQVEVLARRVEELGAEVEQARRSATAPARAYVITSLPDARGTESLPVGAPDRRAGSRLEDRLVRALGSDRDEESRARRRAADSVVRAVALAHGLRRALSPDVLDRAAAEAHVARRRSRRDRRRQLREARRVLRAVPHEQPPREDVA